MITRENLFPRFPLELTPNLDLCYAYQEEARKRGVKFVSFSHETSCDLEHPVNDTKENHEHLH